MGPTVVNVAAATLATVPAGERWLVRTITTFNAGATVRRGRIYVGSVSDANLLYATGDVAATSSKVDGPWFVFNAGEAIVGKAEVGSVTMSLHGYRLQG